MAKRHKKLEYGDGGSNGVGDVKNWGGTRNCFLPHGKKKKNRAGPVRHTKRTNNLNNTQEGEKNRLSKKKKVSMCREGRGKRCLRGGDLSQSKKERRAQIERR